MIRYCPLALGLLLAFGAGSAAADQAVETKWDALRPLIANQKIALALPDATEIQGKALAVGPEGLRMKVTKTSNRKVMHKGERLIPRASVSVIRITQHRGLARLLVPAGVAAVSVALVATRDIDVYEGALVVVVPVVAVGGITGGTIGGYYVGKRIDRKVTYIRVARD